MPAAKLLFLIGINVCAYGVILSYIAHKFRRKHKDLLIYFVLGALMTTPFFVFLKLNINYLFLTLFLGNIGSYLVMAFSEEVLKSIPGFIGAKKDHHFHMVIPFLCAALGFTFIETMLYSLETQTLLDSIIMNFQRLFIVGSFHCLVTIINGLIFLFFTMKYRKYQLLFIVFGLIIASSLHFVFNILQFYNHGAYIYPLILSLYFITQKSYKHVKSKGRLSRKWQFAL